MLDVFSKHLKSLHNCRQDWMACPGWLHQFPLRSSSSATLGMISTWIGNCMYGRRNCRVTRVSALPPWRTWFDQSRTSEATKCSFLSQEPHNVFINILSRFGPPGHQQGTPGMHQHVWNELKKRTPKYQSCIQQCKNLKLPVFCLQYVFLLTYSMELSFLRS